MRRMYSENQIKKLAKFVAENNLGDVDLNVASINAKGGVINGALAVTGNIASSGAITANSITENMSGYSVGFYADIDTWDVDFAYIGACKNGNKLTLVVNGTIKRTADTSDLNPRLLKWVIPQEVADKIIPIIISGSGRVDQKVVNFYYSTGSSLPINTYLTKSGSTEFYLNCALGTLVVDTDYVFRYEVTFLLGENLAPSGE